jgi:predicted nucleic acid-binding protein
MILVDTGFFLASLDPRDGLHERARAWAARINEPLVVAEYVLWETVNFASATAHRAKVHVLVRRVMESEAFEVVPATPELFEAGLALHAGRPDQTWSLTDRLSFVVMTRRGITRALAHDHHFEQAGFEALLRHDPPG